MKKVEGKNINGGRLWTAVGRCSGTKHNGGVAISVYGYSSSTKCESAWNRQLSIHKNYYPRCSHSHWHRTGLN